MSCRILCKAKIADDLEALKSCNVIVAATNSPEPIIFPEHLGPDPTVILDISVPSDVAPDLAQALENVRIVPGSLVAPPVKNSINFAPFGLPDQHMFACMAETALLGLEGGGESYSLGDITLEQVENIASLADKHGFKLD